MLQNAISPKDMAMFVPETVLGKMIGASSMIVGIIVLALPISVISTTFGDVWHEWKEELRLDAKSREEDMKSVELALQVIQNRTFMHVEIYDHFERYPPEFLGQVDWLTPSNRFQREGRGGWCFIPPPSVPWRHTMPPPRCSTQLSSVGLQKSDD